MGLGGSNPSPGAKSLVQARALFRDSCHAETDSPLDYTKYSECTEITARGDFARMPNAAMLWTGGKDSSLALYEAGTLGCDISCLVTFAPRQERFLAHPVAFMRLQAQALGLPHYVLNIEEPFDVGYEDAIFSLKERQGVDTLVTGDIAEAVGHDQNWIEERGANCGVEVVRPLWHRDRVELLNKLLLLRFRAVFSCVKHPWFTDEWLGSELSTNSVKRLSRISEKTGLDICGEHGEYHTLVLDGPRFEKNIRIGSYSKHRAGSIMYIALENPRLEDKAACIL